MNGINPKWGMYLGLAILLEQTIGHGGAALLTGVVPAGWIDHIVAACNMLATLGTVIMTYQASVSSPAPGPLANTSISPAAKVVIIFAVLFGMWAVTPAMAQVSLLPKLHTVTAPAPAPAPAAPATPADIVSNLMTKLDAVKVEVVTGVIGDITAADADAGTLTNAADPTSFRDAISHACYPAEIKFLQSLPSASPTTGSYVLVQLFQKKRDFVSQLKAGLPDYLKIGCGALLGDEVKIFVSLMAMVGVTVSTGGVAGLFPAATMMPALGVLPAL